MGRYISQSDLESRWGVDNVADWSQVNKDQPTTTPDTARIALAIDTAEDTIDDMFRDGRYEIPFAFNGSVSYTLKDWCATLAGIWLYETRLDRRRDGNQDATIEAARSRVLGEVDAYRAGQRKFDAAFKESRATTAPWTVSF